MLRLAQCENAVTIPERMGCRRHGRRVPSGSKTPIGAADGSSGIAVLETRSFLCTLQPSAFRPIFSGLQGEERRRRWPLEKLAGYLLNGHGVSNRGARFGPNFVTILPIEVWVCSL